MLTLRALSSPLLLVLVLRVWSPLSGHALTLEGVGKSCLLLRFADDTYTESYISTIGVDFVRLESFLPCHLLRRGHVHLCEFPADCRP
jgi:hypothetical protein